MVAASLHTRPCRNGFLSARTAQRLPPFVALTATMLLAGCGAEGRSSFQVVDSAGVRIAINDDVSPMPRWRLDPTPLVSIGSVDGPTEYNLHRVYSARSFPDGRMAIAMGLSEIRIYSSEGKHLTTIGRSGDGPGEFRFLWDAHPIGDSEVRAFEIRRRRTMLFDARSGELLADSPLRARFQTPNGVSPLVGDRYAAILMAPEYFEAHVTVANGAEQTADTLGRIEGSTRVDLEASPRPRLIPVFSSTAAGDQVWAGWWGRYEIRKWEKGELTQVIRLNRTPGPITDDLREHLGPNARPFLDYIPFWNKLLATPDGWLWVRRYPDPLEAGAPKTWDIFDPEGRRVAVIETPPDAVIKEVSTHHVLGVFPDSMGVEFVQRRRIARP